MGLKENFMQAAKELISGPENTVKKDEVSPPPTSVRSPEMKSEKTVAPAHRSAQDNPVGARQSISRQVQPRQATLIAQGTVVQGPILAIADMELCGELQGDIESQGNLKICGKLTGKAVGAAISVYGARIQGDLRASGHVDVDENSILIGNLNAESLSLNGRIKGNIVVRKGLSLDAQAVVSGHISAKEITVSDGAILQGEVQITADIEKLFRDEEEKEDKREGQQTGQREEKREEKK